MVFSSLKNDRIANFIKLIIIFEILTFNLISSSENKILTEDDASRNTIIKGCTNLVYSRLQYDQYSIDETARYMMKIFGGTEKEKRDQFISILLFNCVKNIDFESAEKLESQDPEMINSFTEQNLKNLELEKWRSMYHEKKLEKLDLEYKLLASNFNKFSGREEKDPTNIFTDEDKKKLEDEAIKQQKEEEELINDESKREKPTPIGFAGFDIRKFDRMTNTIFAIVFIGLFIFLVLFLLKKLKKEDKIKKNKKNK